MDEPRATPSVVTRSRRLGWKSLLFVIPGLLAMSVGLWAYHNHSVSAAILERFRAQGLPTDPVELNRWYASVPAHENMALALLDAAQAVRDPVSKTNPAYPYFSEKSRMSTLPSARTTHPVAPEDLVRWRKAVDAMPEVWVAMDRARSRPHSRYPVDLRSGFGTALPHLARLKSLSQACALRALVAREEGKAEEAVRSLGDGLRITESLVPEPLLISQWVGTSALGITLGAATDVLSAGPLSPEHLVGLQDRLMAMESTRGMRNGLVGEMAMSMPCFSGSPSQQLQSVMGMGNGPSSGASFLAALAFAGYSASGMNAADQRLYLTWMDRALAASNLPWPESRKAFPPADTFESVSLEDPTMGPHMKSRTLLSHIFSIEEREGDRLARLRLGIAVLAVERHRAAHGGQLPSGLDELVPTFLPSVPMDPFDGRPVRYRRQEKGYSIHSVGRDRKDDDAQIPASNRGRTVEPDVVLRIRR